MQLNTSLTARMEQRQMIAPRMIQSMEILQLGVMALQERLDQEMEENPVLEPGEAPPVDEAETDADEAVAVPEPEADVTDPRKELVIEDSTDNEKDFDRLEAMNEAWADHFNEDSRPSSNHIDEAMDKKHDAMLNMASRPQSLQDYLNDQVGFLDADEAEKELIRYVISHTDERGYLSTPLEEIALSLGEAVPLARLEAALAKVQKLEPPGVGARTVEECLLLQVTNETPYREVVRLLIQHHLEDLQHNRMPIIEKKTGYSLDIIQHAFEVLKHLNPKPGAAFTSDNIPYVVPDILVERKDDGEYDVKLEDDWTPNIFISRRYLDMYRNKAEDPKAREWLKRKLQSAQWLIDAIEQRRSTLIKVTRAIIQHQRAFLDKGPENIEPLKMQQIADLVGVHVTTVSRAVDDKWVQTPRGIFPLKRFFGGGTHTATGEEVAWETIKQKLLEIIGNEDKVNPLSDEDLVNKLSETGYPVARRTVTKYRKMLSIPSSRQRKVWTE